MSDHFDDYPVGYKKPPKHSRFKSGQSGNRKGRPKKSISLFDDVQRELEVRVQVSSNGRTTTMTKREAIAKQLVNGAAKGNARDRAQLLPLIQASEEKTDPRLLEKVVLNIGFVEPKNTIIAKEKDVIEADVSKTTFPVKKPP